MSILAESRESGVLDRRVHSSSNRRRAGANGGGAPVYSRSAEAQSKSEPTVELRCMSDAQANLTSLLRAASSGERDDVNALMAAIYDDLHRLAAGHMRGERRDHTLQPTALVHEAYLKLIDQRSTDWKDRAHFFSVASRVIRRILVDHARGRLADKRGGGQRGLSLHDVEPAAPGAGIDLIALDEALNELQELDPRQAEIVELRFFGGLTIDEIAETLSMGRRSVDREWSAAKAWLSCQLEDQSAGSLDGS